MEKTDTNYSDIIADRVGAEVKKFKEQILKKSKEEIYCEHYAIEFYEEFKEFLTNGFLEDYENIDPLLKWLSDKREPLSFLYDEWLKYDICTYAWDDLFGWIKEVYGRDAQVTKTI